VVRPAHEPLLAFDIGDRHEPEGHRIVWQPEQRSAAAGFERTVFAGLQQDGHFSFVKAGREIDMARAAGHWFCPPGFQGLVAVVGSRAGRRYLLDCRSVFDGSLAGPPLTGEEWLAAGAALGCERPDEQPWPLRSQHRLERLGQAAVEAGLEARWAARYPRGLLRLLVLRDCGLAEAAGERAVRELDAVPSFERVVDRRTPGVHAPLERSVDPGARAWILAHARLPDLQEIVDWAADSADSLTMAAALLPLRRRAEALAAKLRAGSALRQAVDGLVKELRGAARSGQPPADLEARLVALERRLREEEARPLAPNDPAPSGNTRFAAWQRWRAGARAWRRQVDVALGFCERGEGAEPAAAQEVPDVADLARRSERLVMRLPVEHAGSPDATSRLRRLAAEALGGDPAEPASVDRDLVRRRLALIPRLLDDWREEATRWRRLGPPALAAPDELPALLAAADHPRIERAFAEATALAQRLSGTPDLPPLPGAAPRQPPELSCAGFRGWWLELRALDAALARLHHLAREQERWVRQAFGLARSRAAEPARRPAGAAAAAAAVVAGLLEKDPANLSRQEYSALVEALAAMEKADGKR
jgi:hypothetical protein